MWLLMISNTLMKLNWFTFSNHQSFMTSIQERVQPREVLKSLSSEIGSMQLGISLVNLVTRQAKDTIWVVHRSSASHHQLINLDQWKSRSPMAMKGTPLLTLSFITLTLLRSSTSLLSVDLIVAILRSLCLERTSGRLDLVRLSVSSIRLLWLMLPSWRIISSNVILLNFSHLWLHLIWVHLSTSFQSP